MLKTLVHKFSNKVLSVVHFNIRSVKHNFDELLVIIQTFQLAFCDVIILSETHQIQSVNNFNIPGYNAYYNNSDINKNDGVIIFVKAQINNVDIENIKLQLAS